ncbi:MAG: efflux RND transporter periplasmic adaptor subunit [Cohaesibacter sp.]|nr:efflux RND transporter periplasmic adaptor subunit [Cohaesibacter sp.]
MTKISPFLPLIGIALALAGCNEQNAKDADSQADVSVVRPAKIATARSSLITLQKSFPGVTEASRKSILAFRVSGQIMDFPTLSGQELKKGTLIAKLDETPFLNTLSERQASFDLAETELKRSKALFEKKHLSKAGLDRVQSQFDIAKVALKRAKDNLGYTSLVAPFDGIVAKTHIEKFQNIQAGLPVTEFHGNKNIDITFNVPESLFLQLDKSKAQANNAVSIAFDALPDQPFTAWYRKHESVPDVATRSFKVTVSMPRPTQLSVLPGMSVNVSLDLNKVIKQEANPGLLIPLEAVFDQAGKKWVWKLDADYIAHKNEVQVKGIEHGFLRITQGLSEGDKLIAVGVSHITEGQKVRPFEKERGL